MPNKKWGFFYFSVLCVFLAANQGSAEGEGEPSNQAVPAEATTTSPPAPAPSPDIWSAPEPGQVRVEPSAGPSAPAPAVPAAPPQPSDSSAPGIWSTPEPGHSRGDTLPPPPPGSYYPRHYRYADGAHHYDPDRGEDLKELGFTFGTPSVLNLNLGYWGSKAFPYLVRVSGMYYGDTRGIQVDAGYVFDRETLFRQYVAVSAISMQSTVNFYSWSSDGASYYKDLFSGVGPSYGLNWNGLALQVGVAFGQDINIRNYGGGYSYTYGGNLIYNPPTSSNVSQFEPLLIFQIGYTFLW